MGQAGAAFWRGAGQRFVDGPAKHELAAEDLHRLQGCLADHRFAQPPDRALERGGKARGLLLVKHLPGEHQRKGRGVDESAVARAEMARPVDPAKLVGDQRVGRGRIGHPEQRFGQAHQRDSLVGAEAIGLQEGVEPARLAGAGPLDQLRGKVAGRRMDRADRSGPAQPLGQAGLLVHPVGEAQGGAINLCRHGTGS